MVLTDTGLAKVFQRIKSFVIAQLNSKASAIHTHTSSEITDLSNGYVNLSTAQTIGGQKTFTASPRVTKAFPDIALTISDCDVTEMPTEAKYASLYFRDKNNKYLAYVTGQQRIDGKKRMCLRTHRTDDINKYYSVDFDSDGDFYPEQNNSLRLGTPALQWNSTYTRNILIDNDINIASSLINKTSTSGVLSIRGGVNTQDGASIGLYGKDYNGAIAGNIYMTAYGNSDYTNFRIYPNGTMSVYNNSTATTKNVAMQEDVVNLTTAQTIGGNKTFSKIVLKSSRIERGSLPSSNIIEDSEIEIVDKNNRRILGIFNYYYTDGRGRTSFYAYNSNTTDYDNIAISFDFDNANNQKSLLPVVSNAINLGTSTNKWKTFNGLNPGALSLPSISSSGANAWIAIDTTNWVVSLATSTAQKYMPPADGWLNVRVDNAVALGLALTDGGNYMHQMVRSETPSSLALLLPVFKNKEVAILVGGNENFAYTRVTFYPCQGNV